MASPEHPNVHLRFDEISREPISGKPQYCEQFFFTYGRSSCLGLATHRYRPVNGAVRSWVDDHWNFRCGEHIQRLTDKVEWDIRPVVDGDAE